MTAVEHAFDAGQAQARPVDRLLAHYETSHRHPINEAIHMVAIPVIMLSIVGLLYAWHPLVAWAFMGASLVYYLRLSRIFLLLMAGISAAMLAMVHLMGEQRLAVCSALFVGGWIAQFVGHKVEGRKPSFFEDIQYLWVGPLFVLSRLLRRLGVAW
jgi:uncharacterized membrane protein YGL010W